MSKESGTDAENSKWRIKVYAPPREHGKPHVHVISKSGPEEVKISLLDLSILGKTKFSKRAVKEIIKFVHSNYDELIERWEVLHGKK